MENEDFCMYITIHHLLKNYYKTKEINNLLSHVIQCLLLAWPEEESGSIHWIAEDAIHAIYL